MIADVSRRKVWKSILLRAGIVGCCGVVALLLGEVYFRFTAPTPLLSPAYDYNDEIGIIPLPRGANAARTARVRVRALQHERDEIPGEGIPFDDQCCEFILTYQTVTLYRSIHLERLRRAQAVRS